MEYWYVLHSLLHITTHTTYYYTLLHTTTHSHTHIHSGTLTLHSSTLRAEGEEYIYKKLVSKMDEFLELANYDWMMADPTGQVISASTSVLSLNQRGIIIPCSISWLFL